jgi:hypothetical protein
MKTHGPLSKTWKRTGEQVLAAAVAWAIVFAPMVAAAQEKSQGQKSARSSQPPAAVATTSARADNGSTKSEHPGGPQEGIKVHGHWVIEVRNPDGSLASHTEFENALVPATGTSLLAQLLSRGQSFGYFTVVIGDINSPSTGACMRMQQGISRPVNCFITESVTTPSGCGTSTSVSCNLTNTTQPGPGNTVQIQLKGWSVPVDHDATISAVSTTMALCDPTVAPSTACANAGQLTSIFTSATISTPVVKDQVITVTVTFSFA